MFLLLNRIYCMDIRIIIFSSVHQFSSVAQLCLTLCDPMDCSMPGFPVLYCLPEFAQTHIHLVGDAIQPSHVAPFSCRQSFPASGSLPVSSLFASGGQRIGVSTSASVLPMNIEVWFHLGLAGWISLQSKWLWRVFSSITIWKHQSFGAQPSLCSNSHIHTWLLEIPYLWLYRPLSAKWCLCFFNTCLGLS